jgi:hypothetical protein
MALSLRLAVVLVPVLAACGTLTPDPPPTPAQQRAIAAFEKCRVELNAYQMYITRVRPDGLVSFGGPTSFPQQFDMMNCLRANGMVLH